VYDCLLHAKALFSVENTTDAQPPLSTISSAPHVRVMVSTIQRALLLLGVPDRKRVSTSVAVRAPGFGFTR
jgi:hypothetical protein